MVARSLASFLEGGWGDGGCWLWSMSSMNEELMFTLSIMEYGSTPYVRMAPKQNGVSINCV